MMCLPGLRPQCIVGATQTPKLALSQGDRVEGWLSGLRRRIYNPEDVRGKLARAAPKAFRGFESLSLRHWGDPKGSPRPFNATSCA